MRVLLDECVPRRLKRELLGHDVKTAPEMGWASKKNGELLALAAVEFDIFLTSDRNLSHQQNLSAFDIAVIVLVAGSNRIDELRLPDQSRWQSQERLIGKRSRGGMDLHVQPSRVSYGR